MSYNAPLMAAVAEATVAVVGCIMVKELRERHARRSAYFLDAATIVVAAASGIVLLLGLAPPWIAVLMPVPAFVAYMLPGVVVGITGGPRPGGTPRTARRRR
jgi:Ca2+/Na+ antiporter